MGLLEVKGPAFLIEVNPFSLEIGIFGSLSKFPFKKVQSVRNCLNLLVGLIRPISCLDSNESGLKDHGHTQFVGQSQAKTYLVAGFL